MTAPPAIAAGQRLNRALPKTAPEDLEAVREEVDWGSRYHWPTPAARRSRVARQVEAMRSAPLQSLLSSLWQHPKAVEQELTEQLGRPTQNLCKHLGIFEVFTGKARLSSTLERLRGLSSFRLGKVIGCLSC